MLPFRFTRAPPPAGNGISVIHEAPDGNPATVAMRVVGLQ
jgi:hypothetical protein